MRRRELLVGAAVTAIIAALVVGFGPAPGDAAVHLYRTYLVQHGIFVWDNSSYSGWYPLASYSLLYYLPTAVVGNLRSSSPRRSRRRCSSPPSRQGSGDVLRSGR